PIFNDDILFAVDAVASNDIWAVGRSFQEAQTLTIHWDGSNWSIVPSPNGIGDNILFGVAGLSTNDVWAVGNAGSLATLAIHWDGSSWSFVSTPNNNNSNNRLHGITVTPNGTLWAVGTTGVFGQPERTLILRKNP